MTSAWGTESVDPFGSGHWTPLPWLTINHSRRVCLPSSTWLDIESTWNTSGLSTEKASHILGYSAYSRGTRWPRRWEPWSDSWRSQWSPFKRPGVDTEPDCTPRETWLITSGVLVSWSWPCQIRRKGNMMHFQLLPWGWKCLQLGGEIKLGVENCAPLSQDTGEDLRQEKNSAGQWTHVLGWRKIVRSSS